MASPVENLPLRSRSFAIGFAAVAAILGFLPLANWIPGGHAAPWYPTLLSEWLSGSAIVLGAGVVFAIVSRRVDFIWRPGAGNWLVVWSRRRPVAFAATLGCLCFLLYAVVASAVFSRVPISIDELVQLVQAKIFASGRLWLPVSGNTEFFSVLNMVDTNGRYYAQFPPGGPALLAIGVLLGAPWLVGPMCGAVAVAGFWAYVRVVEPRPGVAIGAVLLFAFAPFAVFMSGSHMNHMPTVMCLVLAMAALARVMASERSSPRYALLNGLALGCAATIRPVDAFAFALPAAFWYIRAALGNRARWPDLAASGVGVAIPLCAMMWVNAHTTGEALLFGYQVLWGRSHDLGFHRAPWGIAHTPLRGVELLNLYLLRLQTYLFESSIPSLVPFLGALCLTRRLDRFDRYLIASSVLLLGLYFAYWHDGFLFGPRFVFPLLPVLVLWTARFPVLVRERLGTGIAYRMTWYGMAMAGLLAMFVSIPARTREYARSFVPMRLDFVGAARRANVTNSLVFVRESWGTQLMARMWAIGIPRSETELLYGKVDACLLEQRIRTVERAGVRDTAALLALTPLLVDSARVVKSPFSLDATERYLPGTPYTATCAERVAEDGKGFTLLAPLLYADWGTNLYARDLHEHNLALVRRYPTRRLYLLRPPSNRLGDAPQLYPLARDSVIAVWSGPE